MLFPLSPFIFATPSYYKLPSIFLEGGAPSPILISVSLTLAEEIRD
jgi:hypothetical protein